MDERRITFPAIRWDNAVTMHARLVDANQRDEIDDWLDQNADVPEVSAEGYTRLGIPTNRGDVPPTA